MSRSDSAFRTLGKDSTSFCFSDGSPVPTLQEILEDSRFNTAPRAVVPYLAWEGRTTLLSAREKEGKSTLAGAAAAAVSVGNEFLASATVRGRVVWVGLEEHLGDSARRLARFGANASQVLLVDHLPAGGEDLERLVAQACPSLVVVDTLSAFASEEIEDPASSSQWIPVMQSLTGIARTSGSAVLILHHAGKGGHGYRDSSAIGAAVDTIVEMQSASRETQRKLTSKGRLGPPQQIIVALEGNAFVHTSKRPDIARAILEFIGEHPDSGVRDIRRAVGGRGKAVDDALGQLTDNGQVVNCGTESRYAYRLASQDGSAGYSDSDASLGLQTDRQEDDLELPASGAPGTGRVRPRPLGAGAGHALPRPTQLPGAQR